MKNIAFIINPIAGTVNKKKLPKLISQTLDKSQWLENIVFTEYAGHATELAHQFAQMGFDAVVAVGGDGTVNEVARGLRDTQTALGILPMGSGNGFARHLNISMRVNKAIEMLNHSEAIAVDYGLANDHLFVTTCGTGFDAMIAEQFAADGKRGLKTYLQKIVEDLVSYKPQHYHIAANDGSKLDISTTAFLITFANANQWGNDAYIAPHASIQDGKMDICIMSGKAIFAAPSLALGLFTKMIDKSLFMDGAQAKEITLYREEKAPFHIDGDPVEMEKDIHIRIVEDGLRVLVEKRF
ncbi:MAG: YegS/Rv2252/BmrU family lipid kinase [Paludibacteraceae bacterium]|nr:YegS/Rv2252/BmrU family lipid kinase [Paludibacteraceae bacterium]